MLYNSPLITGTLVRRYKRFLADVILDDGTAVTAHVPNTGSMMSTREPGSPIALSVSASKTRKYAHTLELVGVSGCWVGVNTSRPNHLVAEAVSGGSISALRGFESMRMEVPYGERSRVDLLLSTGEARCYVEVKNVTYRVEDTALFPDAVTERGTRHLRELENMVRQGSRAVIFFLVNRSDCSAMGPASQIDPVYAAALSRSISNGVEAMAYRVCNSLECSVVECELPIVMDM